MSIGTSERNAAEDLVDAIDLMLRAARKLSATADPQLEALADRLLKELQQLDRADSPQQGDPAQRLNVLCSEASRELQRVIEAIALRVESLFREAQPSHDP